MSIPERGILDLTYLAEAADGDAEFIENVLLEYLEDATKHVEELRAALDAGDPESIRRAAHSVKGASANVGAIRVEQVAEELERKGREGDMSETDELIAELTIELSRVRAQCAHGTEALLAAV